MKARVILWACVDMNDLSPTIPVESLKTVVLNKILPSDISIRVEFEAESK